MTEHARAKTETDTAGLEKFPPLEAATADGLLAVGGDLSEARLLYAYRNGIFPWYGAGEPILWWSPDPRCVMFPDAFTAQRSVTKSIRRENFRFTFDTVFEQVITECAVPRTYSDGDDDEKIAGTWITAEMARAYINLHRSGIAHSVEVWRHENGNEKLVGGLYGLAIGGVFFGESMFSRVSDASKAALTVLMQHLLRWDFRLVDCQVSSAHLLRLGAVEIPRDEFIDTLNAALALPGRSNTWSDITA